MNSTENTHITEDSIYNVQEMSLHQAAKYGNVEVTKFLVDGGSDVNAQDDLGKTPIICAIENESLESLKVIQILYNANADIHIADKCGKSALQLVINDSDYRYACIQKFFLEIIHHECMNNSEMTAKKLISLRYPLCQAVLLGNANVIEYMIMNGISVNSCHPDDKLTALAKAVKLMNLEIVKVLIEYGADADVSDTNEFLPIYHYGIETPNSIQHPEIIQILLNKSSWLKDLHQANVIYQFQRAFERGNKIIIQMLLEYHDDILKIKDLEYQTPLHYLCRNYHSDVTEPLENIQINVNVKDLAGRTPLHVATESPFTHINTFRFLLDKGADINATTVFEFGYDVPLFSLCRNRLITKDAFFEIIELFLQYDLNVQHVGSDGTTVFDIIIQKKIFYMAEPLLAHLAILSESRKSILECIHKKIMTHEMLKKYFDVCKTDIADTKNYIINNKLTLYTILINQMSDEQILKSCKFSPNSLSKFEKLKTHFPRNNHYYIFMQKRISSIISNLQLLREATFVMHKLSKSRIDANHLVMVELMYYLDIQDLHNLIKV